MSSSCSTPRLRLHLLGEMHARIDGAPLAGKRYNKLLALLAYLAMAPGRGHAREALAELLWPESVAEAARVNLRQTLYYLRRALGDAGDLLVASRTRVSLADALWLDVREFTAPAPACPGCGADQPCDACLAALEARAGLYHGEFLAGLTLADAPDFERWRDEWRESLRREALALHERLCREFERRGAPERALPQARCYAALEPWDEAGQRRLMRLLAAGGQRGAALAQYETCVAMLARELAIEPEAATTELAGRIHRGELDPPHAAAPGAAGQRRPVTILCCEFELPAELDPEELAERLAAPRRRSEEIARDHGGHVVRAHDGAVLAYFGYPVALEAAARRAVEAALALAAEAGAAARLGVHTGVIVTGGDAGLPDSAGAAPAAARRLCGKTRPGEVLADEATRPLLAGYFQLRAGRRPAGGYRVVARSGAISRLDAAPSLAPLIGRRGELAWLRAHWRAAARGRRNLLLVRADAGLGKSRLVRALRDGLAGGGVHVRELHCFFEYRATPLRPLIALLETVFGFAAQDAPAARRDKLVAYMARHHPELLEAAAPLLAALLSVAPDDAPALPPQPQRQQTQEIVLELLDSLAARRPLLLILEDAHWIDPSSLELLERLARRRTAAPMLTVITARNEFRPDWIGADALLELAPLNRGEVEQLVGALGVALPPAAVADIVERADGVALFAEELAHAAGAERAERPPPAPAGAIPPTLHYLLLAQLDLLRDGRRLAQLAATVGRVFDRGLLAAVAGVDIPALDVELQGLRDARLMVAGAGDSFGFRHALIQEAAYGSQTRAARRDAHRRVAEALSRRFPSRAERQPEQVARHYSEAGMAAAAVPWWLAAGRRALRAYANAEAADHLRAGLAQIAALPAGAQRDAGEVELLLPLGQALLTLHGYGSAHAREVYDRAFALCRGQPPGARRFEVVWGLWMVSSSRQGGGFALSEELAGELLRIAQACAAPGLLAAACSASANIALWRGRLEPACRHAEAALAAWGAGEPAHPGGAMDGHDPRVASLSHLSWGRFAQGREAEALAASDAALALARTLDDPDSLGFALYFAATLQRFRRDAAAAADHAREACALAERFRLPLWRSAGELVLGWTEAAAGDDGGIGRMIASVAMMREVMPGVVVAWQHALAEAYGLLGDGAAQLRTADEALACAAGVGEHFHEAEWHRLRGEGLARLGRRSPARAAFAAALDIAGRQGAHAFSRRAAAARETLSSAPCA